MFDHTIPLPNSEPLFPLLMLHLLLVQFKKIHALFRRRHPLQRPLSPIQRHMLTSQQPHLLHSCVLLSFGATQNQVYHSAAHFATFLALFFFSPTNASNVTGTLERTPWWGKDPVEEDIMPRCFASLNAMLFRHLASRLQQASSALGSRIHAVLRLFWYLGFRNIRNTHCCHQRPRPFGVRGCGQHYRARRWNRARQDYGTSAPAITMR